MLALLSYLFLALFISFLCSITESVLLSTPSAYLSVKINEDKKWAKVFLNYKKNIDKPLAAILSLNTVAHTIGAAGVGAEAVKVFGSSSFGIVSAILTILVLVFSEIIPKTIGAKYCKSLSKISVHIIRFMIFMTYPLVLVSNKITSLFSSGNIDKTTSREEILALTSIGFEEGVFLEKEIKIIQNILSLKNIKVNKVMTPRVVVISVDEDATVDIFNQEKDFLNFSRIPTFSKSNEKITGYILLQDVLKNLAIKNNLSLKVKKLKREVLIYPNTINLFKLFEEFIEKKEHIAIIIDEYGGLDGIVTMEDIIETLLGMEITDETDYAIDMQEYAKNKWTNKSKNTNSR